MAISKFICHCLAPFRLCKGGIRDDGTSCFDHDHWAETRTNIERYLSEDICVPEAETAEKVHQEFHDALAEYLHQLSIARSRQSADLESSAHSLARLNQANASLLAYGPHLVARGTPADAALVHLDIPAVDESDRCLSMARLLAIGAHRAAHELIESIRLGDEVYIFHHHTILYDIVQEMTRLIGEAWTANSEDYLAQDHPHAVSVRQAPEQMATA